MISLLSDASELSVLLGPLDLASRDAIFLPINDSRDADAANSGSHWSLLVFERVSQSFTLLDSMPSRETLPIASIAATRLAAMLGVSTGRMRAPRIAVPDVPRQTNSYDCGVFVISYTHDLAASLKASRNVASAVQGLATTQVQIKALRTELKVRTHIVCMHALPPIAHIICTQEAIAALTH